MNLESAILIQARIGSSRLRSKVLYRINGLSILEIGYKRLKKCKNIKKIIYVIPDNKENEVLKSAIESFGGLVFTGSENDLISRYLNCARKYNIDQIIRITSDCPLVDYLEVDNFIKIYKNISSRNLYLSNYTPPEYASYCNGSDIEIFSYEMLQKADLIYNSKKDREHVTFQFWDGRFKCNHLKINWKNQFPINNVRITVDYPEDLKVLEILSSKIDLIEASLSEISACYIENKLHLINGHFDSKAGWK